MSEGTDNGRMGLVVSDLHLFARRSAGFGRMQELRPRLKRASVLVLNGDTFDFRWSTLPDHPASVERAVEWMETLLADLPACVVHCVLGNHDCLDEFVAELDPLVTRRSNFRWHAGSVQIGDAVFLHGDCANAWMDATVLDRYRASWRCDRQRHGAATTAYEWLDRLGITRLAHRWQFPLRRTLARVAHHLDHTRPRWRDTVRRCYFGHTHEPIPEATHEGITYHNTGSAISGMAFNPLTFAW
ncbi:MAG: metallophosphoesterase [Verrucomicrobiales bacterium]|nr:metallophosphoesterase [Verrucomicrobiales bacterium]